MRRKTFRQTEAFQGDTSRYDKMKPTIFVTIQLVAVILVFSNGTPENMQQLLNEVPRNDRTANTLHGNPIHVRNHVIRQHILGKAY